MGQMRIELPRDHKLSMASEDYLETIYLLKEQNGEDSVRSVDVADALEVSKASVSKALRTLRAAEMIEQSRYGRVVLTPEGEAYARRVWRSHRALRAFLTTCLGVQKKVADKEACLLEHYLSADTMERWCDYLEEQDIVVEDA